MNAESKECSQCKVLLPLTCFGKSATGKQGRRAACNKCRTEQTRLYCKNNKEKVAAYHRGYRQKHLDKKRDYDRKWAETNIVRRKQYKKEWEENNKSHYRQVQKSWRVKNANQLRAKYKIYVKERLKTDAIFTLKGRLRARLKTALRGRYKTGSAVRDLGMPIDAFLVYLNLDALDKYGIPYTGNEHLFHIDHIRPLASFNLEDPEQLKQAVHWANLQILLASENLAKGARTP